MRIFFPNGSLEWPPTNGPSIHRYQVVKNMLALGHEVVTLQPDQNPLPNVQRRNLRTVIQELRRADVIYARTSEKLNAACRLSASPWRHLIRRSTAVVWEVNLAPSLHVAAASSSGAPEVEANIRGYAQAARRVDGAVAVTEQCAQECRERFGVERVVVEQNGSDPDLFDPATPWPEDLRVTKNLRVIWIGSHANKIHHATLIQDLGRLIDERCLPIEVHIIGDTRSMFKAAPPRCFSFHGPVSYLQLPSYLAAMDVGLALYNIAYDQGSPLKLFDYLASETVPLCTESQPMKDVLDGHDAGFVEDWTAERLAEALLSLHGHPNRRRIMAQNGRGLIRSTYNWRSITERVLALLEDCRRARA